MNKISKLALAASAAAFFTGTVMTPVVASAAEGSSAVKCQGINACKGQSKCKTADSACSGQNSCKGKGWLLSPSADECVDQGGTVVE